MKTNNLNSAIDWYSNTILPNVSDSFIKLSSMLSNANISKKEKAHILLVGAQGWPKGWNTVVPTSKLPEFGTMAPYYIEDLLCQIGKGNCPFMIL